MNGNPIQFNYARVLDDDYINIEKELTCQDQERNQIIMQRIS